MKFKCRKCRGLICVGDQVIDHTTGVSPDWSQSFCEPPYCLKGVFIVDAQMVVTRSESLLSRTTEKYSCIKCGSKIGNIGLASCGCGASVSRGFGLIHPKLTSPHIDILYRLQNSYLLHVLLIIIDFG